ncbi:Na(+)/glucose symporter [Sedimentisphaera cyanobacteriorum]|uniref:Na(+)/glucose symporter n=1 Tax=Sedimentisphaera cyanobacteriorum TaxID=1940790 RepID=A0A1Q2HRK8_9BACT|nr:Na+:solute symporter [Sedimentisphaera cyanobacteriorum]AQQ10030.1 Na(+)/glucose symporter [Sedimentisphaera cyanobacteriorum]
MNGLDYIVLGFYLLGILFVGMLFTRKNKSSADMFAAGGQSPWWTSGLSGFMTMFSANTFVVWGGIAYKYGMAAVAINLMYGVAALLVGYFVAGKWKKIGIKSPAEFIQLRYGNKALHFYTWFMMTFRMVGTAGSLYALGTIFTALLTNGDYSLSALNIAIIIFGGIVVLYTMFGGLWAVLMTDTLQFILLNLAVLFVVPLAFMKVGGVGEFINKAPENFFLPVGGSYTWFFLAGWCVIHFFMIGAEWAFVQRFICVPSAKEAKKSSYLFGILYLVSPLLWLLPPMLWRVQSPIPEGATEQEIRVLSENAYILSCKSVLPVGMVGLMVAAMFSATASMVSSQLNVFSGVLTNDIYRPLRGGKLSDSQMVWAGRYFTILLGAVLVGIAISIPYLGGAEKVIISITELMVVALLAPTLWGLFSKKINSFAVWITASTGFISGCIVRFGLSPEGFLSGFEPLSGLSSWVGSHSTETKTFTGVLLPVITLAVIQMFSRKRSEGYDKIQALEAEEDKLKRSGAVKASSLPAIIVAWSLAVCGLLMLVLSFFGKESSGVILTFALTLFAISGFIVIGISRMSKKGKIG